MSVLRGIGEGEVPLAPSRPWSRRWVLLLWITLWVEYLVVGGGEACQALCTCTMRNSGDDPTLPNQRIVCSGNSAISSLSQLELDTLPSNTFLLDLSQNSLMTIPKGSFHGLAALEKLNLENNKISIIEPGAFEGLAKLEKLDLSGNKLTSVNKTLFEGMPNLEKLSLSGNELKVIQEGTFDGLAKLKRLDFDSEYLMCDCHLAWIVKWMKNNVRINSGTTCAVPSELKGRPIKGLKKKDLHCEWPVELPRFELTPSTSQVVFEGDRLPFECRASVIDSSMRLFWVRNDVTVTTNVSLGLHVVTQYSTDMTEMTTSLVVDHLRVSDSGVWTCFVRTSRGNVTKDVNVVVMSDETIYCSPTNTMTNKGSFHWPKIVSGVRVDLECPSGPSSTFTGTQKPHAFYKCDKSGNWQDLDTSQCQFVSEVTRVLEQYAKTDLNNMTKLVNRADQLKRYINTAKVITDKMDIIYLSAIVETLSHQVRTNEKLSDIILDLVSIVMRSSPELLAEAQKEKQACTRMVRAVEELPKQLLSPERRLVQKHARNIAFFAHTVNPETFQSTSCVAFRPTNAAQVYTDSSFFCSPQENFTLTNPAKYMRMGDKEVEAFIHVPATVFQTVRCVYPVCSDNTFTLQFITYRNARLFPIIHRHKFKQQPLEITTNVISAKIVGVSVVDNLTDPVVVSLVTRKPGVYHKAAYWDFLLQDGLGAWDSQGCSVRQEVGNITVMACNHMTNFAILQSPMSAAVRGAVWYKYMFTLPAAVYAGSGILVLCTLAVFCTIAGCHSDLKMPGKAKHSVANMCLSLMLLTLTFTLGVRMTVHVMACQIIGIALHYFSICTFFWILITSYNMYKKFVKAERPEAPPIEPLDGPPVPKPMLRFYLIGWGIAVIVCGITAAVNLTCYADNKPFCFLSLEPSVGAIIVPACILIFINVIFFICICCVVRGHGAPALDEPETEEINELELTNQEIESLPQSHTSNLTGATSLMDLEYRPVSQLRAIATVLLLYMLTWVSAALVITLPFPDTIPYQEIIFTYLYAVLAAALGIFLLIFYCLGREDARENWRRCFSCDRPQQPYTMTSTGGHMTHMNGHIANSHTSLNSSFTNKSSNANNQGPPVRYAQKKPSSNINLVPSHPATATEVSLSSAQDPNVPIFYNPRQNGIAKRYWERHRQKNHLNLLQREVQSDNRSNHSNHNHSGTNSNHQHGGGGGGGNSSDANTHLSIEIQIKSRPRSGTYSPKTVSADPVQPGFSSLPRSQRSAGYSPLTVQTNNHTPLLMPVISSHPMSHHSQQPPIHSQSGYSSGSPAAGVHGVNPVTSASNSQNPSRKMGGPGGANIITPKVNGYYVPASSVSVYPALPPPPSYAYPANSVSSSSNEAGLLGGGGTTSTTNNNTLPRMGSSQHQPQPKVAISQYMQRNGSVPRLRDFDGQSQVSSSTATHHAATTLAAEPRRDRLPSAGSDIQNIEMYKPPVPPVINVLPLGKTGSMLDAGDSATAPETEQDEEDDQSVDLPPAPAGGVSLTGVDVLHQQHVDGKPSTRSATGSECGTNSSRRRKKESFMDELEQRIPHNKMGSSPALSRSTLGGSLDRSTRSRPTSMGSENSQHSGHSRRSHSHSAHSETDSPHGQQASRPPPRSRSHDSHESAKSRDSHDSAHRPTQDSATAANGRGRHPRHHRRHRHQNGRRSSRSLPGKDKAVWEGGEQKERPKPPPYVYVNHSYQEKVVNKLLQQNPNGMVEPIARGLSWFPRSVSAYEQVANADDLDDASSTSSSSDDSTDDIWVLQKNKKKKKFKKETSV